MAELVEAEHALQSSGPPDALSMKEFIAGAAGGVAQVLIGQPFDIVKVRLQTQGGGSAMQCATNIWRNEGPLAFYKGSLVPLLGIGACVSVQFSAFQYFRGLLESRNEIMRHSGKQALSIPEFYIAGGAAGLTNSVISGPIEHVRIRLQTQPHGTAKLYTGPVDCVRKIISQAGVAGLYRGQAVTLLREFHGYGIWFATFEALMESEIKIKKSPREEIPSWRVALYGGLAGEALWLGSHPLDVIKSKMQSDGFGAQQKYSTMRSCFAQTWRTGGIRALFHGLGPALLRAMPVSAGTFATVEMVKRALN